MKIRFISDIHAEFYSDPSWLPPLPSADDCDVLVLGGDISSGGGTIDTVRRIGAALPKTQILFIAGNHDFYGVEIGDQIEKFRTAFENDDRIHFLENDSLTMDGVRFLGASLWSGFDLLGRDQLKTAMKVAGERINDFRLIKDASSKSTGRFKPYAAVQRYKASRMLLADELKKGNPEKTIVITHFPPCREARHPGFPEDELTCYFTANCGALITQHQPAAWIYGHNHWSADFHIGKTRLVSNQMGYPQETKYIPGYDENKVIIL